MEKTEVLGMNGEKYDGGAGDDVFKMGGCKSQLSYDPPSNYTGMSVIRGSWSHRDQIAI